MKACLPNQGAHTGVIAAVAGCRHGAVVLAEVERRPPACERVGALAFSAARERPVRHRGHTATHARGLDDAAACGRTSSGPRLRTLG